MSMKDIVMISQPMQGLTSCEQEVSYPLQVGDELCLT